MSGLLLKINKNYLILIFFFTDAKSAEKCFNKLQKLDIGLDDSFTDELYNRVHGVVKASKSSGKKRAQEAPKKPSPKVTLWLTHTGKVAN